MAIQRCKYGHEYDTDKYGNVCPCCGNDIETQREKYPTSLRPGSILNGRYIIGRVLGQGGFGITYAAWDDRNAERVAVKEFFPHEIANRAEGSFPVQPYTDERREYFEQGRNKFLAEAKTLAEFRGNKNIVQVYSYFEENNTAYFVMEYVDGESLKSYARRHGGRISMEKACELLMPVMSALDSVHAKGIVHRDIAPDNILIGRDETAKLIDFGAARYSTGEKTKSLDIIRKEGFSPKEQYLRRGRQGPFTDVYSLAATIYYAVTGKVPPDAISRIDEDELLTPAALNVNMPGRTEKVLLKALQVDANKRYQTMADFQKALQAAMPKETKETNTDTDRKLLKRIIPAVCAIIAAAILTNFVIIPTIKYNNAVSLMNHGRYEEAIAAFEEIGDYKDSTQKIKDCEAAVLEERYIAALALMEEGKYEEAIAVFESLNGYRDSENWIRERIQEQYDAAAELANKGKTAEAAIAFGKLGDFRDSRERSFEYWDEVAFRESVSAGYSHTVGLKTDGTVVAAGGKYDIACNVSGWKDIVAVSAGWYQTVGLKTDGTVVAVGENDDGQCNVSGWKDIVAVSAGYFYTVGLKSDGTVVAVGNNHFGKCDVSGWKDIVAVSAGYYHTVGLKSDGTVVAVGKNNYGQCDVSGWTDIVAVSVGYFHTVGLKSDGTLVAVGWNGDGQCNVSGWTDIVAVSAEWNYTVGLKSDGTVVAVGNNEYGQCDVSGWTDIVAVSARGAHTIGLKSDGTVVAVGYNFFGQCDVSDWTDIKLPK